MSCNNEVTKIKTVLPKKRTITQRYEIGKELRYLSCLPFPDPCDQVNRHDNSTINYFYRCERKPNSIHQSFARQTSEMLDL